VVPFVDVRSTLARARREGERLAARIGRDVRALMPRDSAALSADMVAFQRAMRRRAEEALQEIEAGGALVISVVGKASTLVLGRLSGPSQDEVEALGRRVALLEKRLAALERRRAKARQPTA
jgi:class 3 adenylate cyclase